MEPAHAVQWMLWHWSIGHIHFLYMQLWLVMFSMQVTFYFTLWIFIYTHFKPSLRRVLGLFHTHSFGMVPCLRYRVSHAWKEQRASDCLPQRRHKKENTRQRCSPVNHYHSLKKTQMADIYKLSERRFLVSLMLGLNVSSRITDFGKCDSLWRSVKSNANFILWANFKFFIWNQRPQISILLETLNFKEKEPLRKGVRLLLLFLRTQHSFIQSI